MKTLVFVLPVYLVLQRTAAAKARPAKAVTVKATPALEDVAYFQNPLSCPSSPPPPPLPPPPIRKIPVSLLIVLLISSTTGEGPPAEAVEVVKKKSKSMDDGCKE